MFKSLTKSKNASEERKEPNTFLKVLKASVFGVFISLVLVLIFAIILRFTNLSNNLIRPINTVIKGLSILIATIFVCKGATSKMWLKGLFVGLVYFLLSFLVFSALDGSFVVNITTLTDFVFELVAGLFSGIICSIFKK